MTIRLSPVLGVLGAAAVAFTLAACGNDAPAPAPAGPPGAGAGGVGAALRTVLPHREAITPEMDAKVADIVLAARDEPLAEGATAPAFDGLPTGATTMVVFYRGHW